MSSGVKCPTCQRSLDPEVYDFKDGECYPCYTSQIQFDPSVFVTVDPNNRTPSTRDHMIMAEQRQGVELEPYSGN